MRSYPSWIAGLRYRGRDGTNRGRYCCRLEEGARVLLMPEPDNRYSDHAVAVVHQGRHLGYIPDRHDWVAGALSEGKQLSCTVSKVETEGWFFRRASFVGLLVTVEGDPAVEALQAAAEQRRRENSARDACMDGLRVLAFMAMADGAVRPEEIDLEVYYIESRLRMAGIECDAALVDAMLALSQGLVVTKHGLTRAVNRIAADPKHYKLVLDIALKLHELAGETKGVELQALERLRKAGNAKGWI
jgi:hypothetical protein